MANDTEEDISLKMVGLELMFLTPEKYSNDEKRAKLGSRIAGIICILVGILTRYIP